MGPGVLQHQVVFHPRKQWVTPEIVSHGCMAAVFVEFCRGGFFAWGNGLILFLELLLQSPYPGLTSFNMMAKEKHCSVASAAKPQAAQEGSSILTCMYV